MQMTILQLKLLINKNKKNLQNKIKNKNIKEIIKSIKNTRNLTKIK